MFLLAVFGRKVYWFKLLSELSLNSGYDYLAPGLVHLRQESLPRHYADRPVSHGVSNLPQRVTPGQAPFS